jgi:hypothetical protein
VRFSHSAQFIGGFGKRNVESWLAQPDSFEQELQRKRGFPSPGRSFDQIKSVGRQPASQYIVEQPVA